MGAAKRMEDPSFVKRCDTLKQLLRDQYQDLVELRTPFSPLVAPQLFLQESLVRRRYFQIQNSFGLPLDGDQGLRLGLILGLSLGWSLGWS